MKKFYFTFGSSEKFPYQNGHLIVKARCIEDAVDTFKKKYPDRTEGFMNCSFIYEEWEWKRTIMYERGEEPKEILVSEKVADQLEIAAIILENSLKAAMEELIGTTRDFKEEWLENEIGTTIEELEELGVDIDEIISA